MRGLRRLVVLLVAPSLAVAGLPGTSSGAKPTVDDICGRQSDQASERMDVGQPDNRYASWGPHRERELRTKTKRTTLTLDSCTAASGGEVIGVAHAQNHFKTTVDKGFPVPQVQYHYFNVTARLEDSAGRRWVKTCEHRDVSGDDIQHIACRAEGKLTPSFSYFTFTEVCYDTKDEGKDGSCMESSTGKVFPPDDEADVNP